MSTKRPKRKRDESPPEEIPEARIEKRVSMRVWITNSDARILAIKGANHPEGPFTATQYVSMRIGDVCREK